MRFARLQRPCSSHIAARRSAAELPANDYPTVARADYVFGCMQVNGQTRDALERCSCSIDVIASLLPFDQYEEAETVMRVRQRGGKNASMFLSMPMLRAQGRRAETRAGRGGAALLLTRVTLPNKGAGTFRPQEFSPTGGVPNFCGPLPDAMSRCFAFTFLCPRPVRLAERREMMPRIATVALSSRTL